ncbi:serine/threonine protein kinase [Chlamydia muridarum str. Nigg]|uniref:Protein kinase n=2 Tax=Chlamydia muridarum TaxID=83560 RepID=A0A097KDY3_CHLMR|nr:serine/threonine-protein kinase [Chlamydia muridarum]AAF73522.1 serine/threonine-protein kinase [Chlamydia muridarum str. Nigg]AHH22443.1 protein kinase [Chlamydia muridarum str. Nigg3 CMUT3-5]AHH23367.1 protein kinase [Chlamydia muridarum str. Nigg CM972]AID37596.1 protein kinase [Chlamydia muridarum str. Nigg 2 MCR]AIT90286.1 protein kinase [Chlamydia muridarum]
MLELGVSFPSKTKYLLTRELSRKVGLTVYQGVDESSSRPVVIKALVSPGIHDQRFLRAFEEEARIMQLVDHPAFVRLEEKGEWEQGRYFVSEYILGHSLRDIILSSHLALDKAVSIVLQVAQAITALHKHHVLHLDIKPENIMISRLGEVKLIDYGLSAWQFNHWGSPAYMSPEQSRQEKLSPASDVYALALLAYELIMGQLSLGKVYLSLLPVKISKVLTQALQPDPEARFPSMQEFATALQDYLMHDVHEDYRKKDRVIMQFEQLQQQNMWLAPDKLCMPEGMALHIYSQKEPCDLHNVYYDILRSEDIVELWFCYAQGHCSFALSMIKQFLNQRTEKAQDIPTVIKTLDTLCKTMHIPLCEKGISCCCFIFFQQELMCFSCGKTDFSLKKQTRGVQRFQAESQGIGEEGPLEIHKQSFLWEPGDELIVHTPRARDLVYLYCPSFLKLQDRGQMDIFCQTDYLQKEVRQKYDGSLYPSTLISLKRVR